VSDDLQLWDAWATGDTQAGEAFAERHFVAVFRFFESKVADVAEELTQRTFLSFLEGRARYQSRGSVRAFLFGVARHQLLRHYEGRDERGRKRVDLSQLSAHDLDPSASQVVAARERQDAVLLALRRLPVDAQITLELHYWNELSVAEIAAALDEPPGTIKSRLSRARARLRVELGVALEGAPVGVVLTEADVAARTRRLGDTLAELNQPAARGSRPQRAGRS